MPVLFDFHLCRPRRVVNRRPDPGPQPADRACRPALAPAGQHPRAPVCQRRPLGGDWSLGSVQRAGVGDLRRRDLEPCLERLEIGHARIPSRGRDAGALGDPAAGDGRHGQRDDARAWCAASGSTSISRIGTTASKIARSRWGATRRHSTATRRSSWASSRRATQPGRRASCSATAEQSGYAGAYFWSALADDGFTHLEQATAAVAERNLSTVASVNETSNHHGGSWRKSIQTCSDSRRNSA